MTTTAERARLDQIAERLAGLHREIAARPAAEAEVRIADTAAQLAEVPGLPRFPFESLIMFRMTDADRRLEADLIGEWNTIARAVRARRADRRQAKVNAREVAKVRAAACPTCFASHAGEC